MICLNLKSNSSHNPHKTTLVKSRKIRIVKIMKKLNLAIFCIALSFSLFTFGQDKPVINSLYEFAPKVTVTEDKKVVPEEKPAVVTEESTTDVPEKTTQDVLVADAQTLIKDKLVQKYQVKLDDVITRLTGKLQTVSAESQRTALTELRTRIGEKKSVIIAQKDFDPLKKEIIVALLDHILLRIEGLIQQSAQNEAQKPKA